MNKDNEIMLAHISDDRTRVQKVCDHLKNVADLASSFAKSFGGNRDAYCAGILHDIGKYSAEFQKRLEGGRIVDHATAGALEAYKRQQLQVAFAVIGHHGGLPDGGNRNSPSSSSTFCGRLKRELPDYSKWKEEISVPETSIPSKIQGDGNFSLAFYIRMLYSCLVDADFLDTELFMRGRTPRGEHESIEKLCKRMEQKADEWLNIVSPTPMNQKRNAVLRTCLRCGEEFAPGVYTLTVPTGGGKTFASLAFALKHAVVHNKKRVIYVIPYKSIIDQTVEFFRKILGDENVLAHHSTADWRMNPKEEMSQRDYRQMLSAENWDVPVIVTTSVQFFESLYANHPSRCRKLHNIANSVIIFDEAQTFPVPFMMPCIGAISQLVKNYEATAVLCTATQPPLEEFFRKVYSSDFVLREICQEAKSLYKDTRRVTLSDLGKISLESIKERLREKDQVLCVVNTRKMAQDLFKSLPEGGSFCLTTLLCPHDRSRILSEIRKRLEGGFACRVVSTSLIEAGVDVDFPVVYREVAGLDSILQTMGRCNREGRRSADESFAYLFYIKEEPILYLIQQNIDALNHVKRQYQNNLEEDKAIDCYFESLWKLKGDEELDKEDILMAFEKGKGGSYLPFETVASNFNMIDSPTHNIYIPCGDGKKLCERLVNGEYNRVLLRKLGEYCVQVYDNQMQDLTDAGVLHDLGDVGAVLISMEQYDSSVGLCVNIAGGRGIII